MLDIRDLAADWQDELNEPTDADLSAYKALCAELGIDPTPDALSTFGDEFEAMLIPENEFEDYARNLAEECGMLDSDPKWPYTCIDWKHAASELAYDYTLIRYDGADYYIRSW